MPLRQQKYESWGSVKTKDTLLRRLTDLVVRKKDYGLKQNDEQNFETKMYLRGVFKHEMINIMFNDINTNK